MKIKYIYLILILFFNFSCTKDWLEIKTNKQVVVPTTLSDLEALLNNARVMNTSVPVIGEISSDDYYIRDNLFVGIKNIWEKNTYLWNETIFTDQTISGVSGDWCYPYNRIYYSNVILGALEKVDSRT